MTIKKKTTASVALVAVLALAGCSGAITTGSDLEKGPVGTGPTVKELKATPCACTEIPMKFDFVSAG